MRWVCAAAMLALPVAAGLAQNTGRDTNRGKQIFMREKIQRAIEAIDRFEKSRRPQELEKAVDDLEEVDVLSLKQTVERLAARRDLLRAWCRALNGIDSLKDPHFDPDDAPLLNVMPPLEASGQVPPQSTSPAAQKEYETAVAANEKKKAERRTQFLARELEARAVESAHRLVERMYTKSAPDRKELADIFAGTRLPLPRQAELTGSGR